MRTTTWGEISTLHYGRALTDYGSIPLEVQVFGTNGPIGYTSAAPMGAGPAVIVGRKGAYRGVHLSRGSFWVIDTAFYLQVGSDIDMGWAYYALLTADINGLQSGSAVPSTTREDFYQLRVSVPPLETQRAIVQVLAALDDKIAANAKLISTSEELALTLASVTQQYVVLGEVVDVSRNARAPSAFGVRRVWHYSLPAFDDGRQPSLDLSEHIGSAKFVVESPCVLISKLNPRFPRAWDLPELLAGVSVASTEFVVLLPRACSTSVLWAAIAQPAFGPVLEGKVAGTSGSHQRVKPADLLATEVIDPRSISPEVQAQVTSLGRLSNQLRHETQQVHIVRDTLLPQLMSGKLRVRDAEKQVEAVV